MTTIGQGAVSGPGLVDNESARIWIRLRQSGRHWLTFQGTNEKRFNVEVCCALTLDESAGGTCSVQYPQDFENAPPLPSHCTLEYEIRDEQGVLGRGRFKTAPESIDEVADEFAIAVFSCHQPFASSGQPYQASFDALKRLPEVLEQNQVVRVLALGDQMYADMPSGYSLFESDYFRTIGPPGRQDILSCTSDEVRQLFHERFVSYWGVAGFSETISRWATMMICDDHEIVDNFGTPPEHSEPRWQNLRKGALDAIFDYEGQRQQARVHGRPESFHFEWEYGPVAAFVMDLRSQRRDLGGELQCFSEQQLAELERHLARHGDKPVQLLGLSVPLAFAPKNLVDLGIKLTGEGGDSAERWWNKRSAECRHKLLRVLRSHRERYPEQLFILLSGDVHAGVVDRVHLGNGHDVFQMISSPISNLQDPLSQWAAEKIPELGPWENGEIDWELLSSEDPDTADNPHAGLNVGLIKFRRRNSRFEAKLALVGLSEGSEPRTVFESKVLSAT